MEILNFKPCVLNPRNSDFLSNLGAVPGYYLLKIEEDHSSWGGKNTPVHVTRYTLMQVTKCASGLMGMCEGIFIENITGTVTGYRALGINDTVKEI